MSASELQDQLGTQSFRDSYMNKLESWEELRRPGSGVFMAQGIAETA